MDANLNFRRDLVQVQNELFRFAYKLTANYDDAKDLLQETSLKALYNEDKYIPGTN
ncbi:ECF RNA polymerase sigma factor SigH, partial [termite gut metagenome]